MAVSTIQVDAMSYWTALLAWFAGLWERLYEVVLFLGLRHLGSFAAILAVAMALNLVYIFGRDAASNFTHKVVIFVIYIFFLIGFWFWRLSTLHLSWDSGIGYGSLEMTSELLVLILIFASFGLTLAISVLTRWRRHAVMTHVGLLVVVFFAEWAFSLAWEPTLVSFAVLSLVIILWIVITQPPVS